jgi:hypothetical protein
MEDDYYKIELYINTNKIFKKKTYRSLSDPIDYYYKMFDEKQGFLK